jgi:hypothetical protein
MRTRNDPITDVSIAGCAGIPLGTTRGGAPAGLAAVPAVFAVDVAVLAVAVFGAVTVGISAAKDGNFAAMV